MPASSSRRTAPRLSRLPHLPRHAPRWRAASGALALAAAGALAAASAAASETAVPAAASATAVPAAASGAATSTVRAGLSSAVPANRAGARQACGWVPAGHAACQAIVDTAVAWDGSAWATGASRAAASLATAPPDAVPAVTAAAPLAPYMAAGLQSAYRLPSASRGAGQIIAIVDAYDDPRAAADLATYRAANHLPPCTAASGCFAKVNQRGRRGRYPPADPGWAVEESLDVDMASAACPKCKIILVEADNDLLASLAAATDMAARLGADVISNSYGGAEYDGDLADLASHYDHRGVAITAASGDSGFGVIVPAAFATVTAVGGTTLYRSMTRRGWSELAWGNGADSAGLGGAGSGCSANVPRPRWQHDPLCGHRTVADVAAVADPDTPVAVRDTFGEPGWIAVGGTSVASPLIAGVYALAGNAATAGTGASRLYAHRQDLFDVVYQPGVSLVAPQSTGDCGGSYLCTAATGYDGPTGLGTPDGTGAF